MVVADAAGGGLGGCRRRPRDRGSPSRRVRLQGVFHLGNESGRGGLGPGLRRKRAVRSALRYGLEGFAKGSLIRLFLIEFA